MTDRFLRDRLGAGPGQSFEARLRIVAVGIVLVFGLFVLRLFQLQIIEGERLRERSARNFIRTVRLEAPRGEIVDRAGRVLATTRPAFGLQVIPNELRGEVAFPVLAQLLETDAAVLRDAVGELGGLRRYRPLQLASDLSWDHLARIESHRYALPGVITDVRPRRHYVFGTRAAHVLGSIGEIRKDQLETRRFARYRAGEIVGQSGIEAVLEAHLRGRAGGRNVVVDVTGREVQRLDEVVPAPGRTVVLSLDLDLQRAAEEAFDGDEPEAPRRAGALVALDPQTGSVLAYVSRPAYDPNEFPGGIDADVWQALSNDPLRPLQDRVISGRYPPASTYKALVASAALQEKVVGRDEKIFCPGWFRLGRRTYRCWKQGGHGDVDLHEALVQSCDVYFYQLGRRLGIDRLAFFARGFGLGRPTGIELPQEKAGLVPTRAWKRQAIGEPWVDGETVSAAIGQGFNTTTPLQLAVAYAAIANGGRLVTPRLVERIEERGALVEKRGPVWRGKVPVDPEVLDVVGDALLGVVQERRGTGARARVPGVAIAGKTGTAQTVGRESVADYEEDEIPRELRDHAWFVGYGPVPEPEIVVAVLVEHGGGGGSVAAPIAQRVLARHFEKHPPDPAGEPPPGSPSGGTPPHQGNPPPADATGVAEVADARP